MAAGVDAVPLWGKMVRIHNRTVEPVKPTKFSRLFGNKNPVHIEAGDEHSRGAAGSTACAGVFGAWRLDSRTRLSEHLVQLV